MPRKASAALSIVPLRVDGQPNHISPPSNLGATERRLFNNVVRSMPSHHFRDCDVPLLTRFVEAIAMTERAGREMEGTGGPVVKGAMNPWFSVQQRSSKMVAVLATRLRMSPQSRRETKAADKYRRPSAYETLGDDD